VIWADRPFNCTSIDTDTSGVRRKNRRTQIERNRRSALFLNGGQTIWTVWLAAVLIVLASSACIFPGDDGGMSPPPCECPNLERIVESIDWAPGARGHQTSNSASDDQTRRGVIYQFDVTDAESEIDSLRVLFDQAGWVIEETTGGFKVNGPKYGVFISELNDKLRVSVALLDGASDTEAAAILAPLVEAIKTGA